MSIVVRAGVKDSTDSVIRKFQKRVVMEGVMQQYRELAFHKKESEKRQERLAQKRIKIKRAKRMENYS